MDDNQLAKIAKNRESKQFHLLEGFQNVGKVEHHRRIVMDNG